MKRLFAAVAVLAAAAVAHAALPTFWQVSTEAEFLQGDVENLSIDSYGRLSLGPATDTVYESSAPFLWTMISAPDGAVFVGSGNEGQIHRIDATGKGTLFFDAEELEVHAIVAAPGGGIYAATSPDGKIYKVSASGTGTGAGTVFFDPPDKYIWSLAVDRAGNVYAGTGDKGIIYKIGADGRGAPVLSDQGHARHVAGVRSRRTPAGRHRIARPRLPDRRVGQAVRPARLALQRNPHAAGRRQRQHLRRGGERPRRSGERSSRAGPGPVSRSAADRVRLGGSHLDHHRR